MSSWFDEQAWCEENFSGIDLGDCRRSDRVMSLARAFAAHPGRSIPQLFDRPYDVKASYSLLRHEAATPDSLQAGHRDLVAVEMYRPGTYLLLEDGSDLSWAGNKPIRGLGPIGTGAEGLQGFILHTVMAVRWPDDGLPTIPNTCRPLDVLGLADQQYYVRPPKKPKKPKEPEATRRREGGEALESRIWEKAGARIGDAPSDPSIRWVRVADAGADIYDFLLDCQNRHHDFVVRASHDRVLVDEAGRKMGKLVEQVQRAPAAGEFDLDLRSRPGKKARTARLSVSYTSVCMRSPQRLGHVPGGLPAIQCGVVHIWEAAPPPDVEPLEWILLTSQVVTSFEEALTCGLQYAARWLIEEFHKALKTGLGAERLQLEQASALFAAISIMSVVALRLLDLRERMRWMPDAPSDESGLDPLELKILAKRLDRRLKTIRDVVLAIGRLGGHMNRKADGSPGWLTLWRGMLELQTLVAGARLAAQLKRFG